MSRLTQDDATATHASHTGLSPSKAGLSRPFRSHSLSDIAFLQPRHRRNDTGLGSSPVARHYWGNHCLFSLPTGTKMFQFPALALRISGVTGLQPDRLSHSEIPGSKIICIYPGLIAAYHVLHRLCEPRHPPCALSYFLYYDTLSFPLARMRAPLILSAVLLCEINFFLWEIFFTLLLQFCLVSICQRSLYLPAPCGVSKYWWRITDSNR